MIHNVVHDTLNKFPELAGLSTMTFNGVVITSAMLEKINGALQTVSIIGTIAVSICTCYYMIRKAKKLK